ncbi:hypothetical protein ColTof4_14229 [Colletotrichum tofieldiae]|nr:hypothetical protein ColTof3_00085 [Colletotrichum tofieldiae]GKT81806.1 hypothetical protein ColTof4_14229 [Colletotrichum tofieldiae]GKT88987.1 hypothetical protein Ct61P_06837 [Colletotrichum tofieldiae]
MPGRPMTTAAYTYGVQALVITEIVSRDRRMLVYTMYPTGSTVPRVNHGYNGVAGGGTLLVRWGAA